MTQTLESKEVIESLQNIIIDLENIRLNSFDLSEHHHSKRQYSFSNYFSGKTAALDESIYLINKYLNLLTIKK